MLLFRAPTALQERLETLHELQELQSLHKLSEQYENSGSQEVKLTPEQSALPQVRFELWDSFSQNMHEKIVDDIIQHRIDWVQEIYSMRAISGILFGTGFDLWSSIANILGFSMYSWGVHCWCCWMIFPCPSLTNYMKPILVAFSEGLPWVWRLSDKDSSAIWFYLHYILL